MSSPLVCPACRVVVQAVPRGLACGACGAHYPVENEIADFSAGSSYDQFVPGQTLSETERQGLANEEAGAAARIGFYRPLLGRQPATPAPRVLDCGCGNGLSVDLLADAGFEAWGNDLSALRKWQWRKRRRRDRLVVADSARLPFAEGFFDAVLCSGVLEHVGVAEEGGETYSVTPLPEKEEARRRLLRELLRVLSPSGRLWLDFPNGAFPIDFWHGPVPGGARFHPRDEGFLPTVGEVRQLLAALDPGARLRLHGPSGRLRFRQVRRHWYGRLLAWPVGLYLRTLGLPGLRPLIAVASPYLVVEIRPTAGPAAPRSAR